MRKRPSTSLIFNILGPSLCGLLVYTLGGVSNLIFKLKAKHITARMKHSSSPFTYIDIESAIKNKENNLCIKFPNDGIHINGIAYNIWKKQLTSWFPIE